MNILKNFISFVLNQYCIVFRQSAFTAHTTFYNFKFNRTRSVSHKLQRVSFGKSPENALVYVCNQQLNLSHITSYKLHIILSHMRCITNETTDRSRDMSYYRFNVLLSLLRFAGIPLKVKSVSKVTKIYNATIIVCFYFTNICLCMDTYVHRHDLVQYMKKFRVAISLQVITWTHFSLR